MSNVLTQFIDREELTVPVKLGISLLKVVHDPYMGNDKRYMKVYIKRNDGTEADVTGLCAALLGKKLSKDRNAYNSLIMHGSNEDMGWRLTDNIRRTIGANGDNGNWIDTDYRYLGRRFEA